jgi:hypothetical protein
MILCLPRRLNRTLNPHLNCGSLRGTSLNSSAPIRAALSTLPTPCRHLKRERMTIVKS